MPKAATAHFLPKLKRLGPAGWLDLVRASLELALARFKVGSQTVSELVRTAHQAEAAEPQSLTDLQLRLVDRVAFVLPRVGPRLPWRADCLVQAIAAQRWLGRNGISTNLYIGVQKATPAEFEAHAWLMSGDTVVTGGDRKGFTPLVTPTRPLPGSR